MFSRKIAVLLVLCIAFLAVGCKNQANKEAELRDLRTQVAELSRQVNDAHVRIEEMNNRLFLLQETRSAKASDTKNMPRDLKIVKLVPKEDNKTPKRAKHAETLTSKAQNGYNNAVQQKPVPLISNWDGGTITGVKKERKKAVKKSDNAEYQKALEIYRAGKYSEAIVAFARFTKKYKNSSLADNAVFWSGICYFEQQEYDLAIEEFKNVAKMKKTNKASDALYYIGQSYLRKGNTESANKFFKELEKRFPKSEAAKKAKKAMSAKG